MWYGSRAMKITLGEMDFWRSLVAAISIDNGDDPDVAVRRHQEWCEKMDIQIEGDDEF